MIYLFYTLHILVCVFLILVVLLQQGKGADLSVFGGGSTQTAFGSRGAATLLHKLTVGSFILFIVTTMAIAVLSGGPGGATVMSDTLQQEAQEESSPEPVDAAPAPVSPAEQSDRLNQLTGGAADEPASAPESAPANPVEPAPESPTQPPQQP